MKLGYLEGELDGNFGRKTKGAVMLFQSVHGLQEDGVAGPETLGHLFSEDAQNAPQASPAPTAIAVSSESFGEIAVGDRMTFGTYKDEPIQWRVLAIEDGQALLLSEYILVSMKYTDSGMPLWAESTLREYLKSNFYVRCFTPEEKERIQETTTLTNGAYGTKDQIFLLSLEEAELYFVDDADRQAISVDTKSNRWWLRSRRTRQRAIFVESDGSIDVKGVVPTAWSFGVRPAFWLKL